MLFVIAITVLYFVTFAIFDSATRKQVQYTKQHRAAINRKNAVMSRRYISPKYKAWTK